jgi:Ras-related protein Rab-1A
MAEVEKHAGDNITRILVGNKCDLESKRAVSTEEGQELADHYNVRFLETSAKDSKNVDRAFVLMTREIKNRVAVSQPKKTTEGPQSSSDSRLKLGASNSVKNPMRAGCC